MCGHGNFQRNTVHKLKLEFDSSLSRFQKKADEANTRVDTCRVGLLVNGPPGRNRVALYLVVRTLMPTIRHSERGKAIRKYLAIRQPSMSGGSKLTSTRSGWRPAANISDGSTS